MQPKPSWTGPEMVCLWLAIACTVAGFVFPPLWGFGVVLWISVNMCRNHRRNSP
jgi:hypothetical protein